LEGISYKHIDIRLLGKDSSGKQVDGMFTQPDVPRTFQGSNTNILNVLDPWKVLGTYFLGKDF
jgi:hypothetical protein